MSEPKPIRQRALQLWRSCQSRTSKQLRDAWQSFIRGWCQYYQLAEDRQSIYWLEGWMRRHIRKLRSLGVKGRLLKVASACRGAWRVAAGRAMQSALTNAVLQAKGFLMPSDLAARRQGC